MIKWLISFISLKKQCNAVSLINWWLIWYCVQWKFICFQNDQLGYFLFLFIFLFLRGWQIFPGYCNQNSFPLWKKQIVFLVPCLITVIDNKSKTFNDQFALVRQSDLADQVSVVYHMWFFPLFFLFFLFTLRDLISFVI